MQVWLQGFCCPWQMENSHSQNHAINCDNIYSKVNKPQIGLYCIFITSTSSIGDENIQDTKALLTRVLNFKSYKC